ncbi:AraC family transcriptional regulator [Clostridium estertheticum]|uniref:AraC family transcriptional regulator n=1 Tax=Clostridium estertheticum TaxID=238834 RepID=UPI001CF5B1DF|nr:AraC family transcriptional regulator [Clostridium estertheticum]MCB2305580.1 AraC family transcriptional regulator [Clostridium estertheticum]MCB2344019.1 AraC family transcriptional regulator [Clostridium estertheticum]MCB2348935.1 AraC family transcriptional regulator [Clostridium estertheticum]WAG46250.1 AraC family transcriptional regulator [Clostridium estertheticum]
MNKEDLDKLLKKYTKDELLYKQYFNAQKNKASYETFIKNIDMNFVKERNILIPTVNDFYSSISERDIIFERKSEFNVFVLKHYRYTPEFKHKHDFFEMVFVYTGSCKQNINGDELSLLEGDMCIISPDVPHSISVFDDSVIVNVIIRKSTFNNTFLELLSDENIISSFFIKILYTNNYNSYIVFRKNSSSAKETMYNIIIEYFENRKYNNKILDNLIMLLFAYLLRDENNKVDLPKELEKNTNQITSILIHIQSNFRTVTLNELSQMYHYTVPYLSKIIKTYTGHNFKEIVQLIKFNKAVELLTTSNFKICDISESLGYENNTHFIRTFKKTYGMSPNQYRKSILKT